MTKPVTGWRRWAAALAACALLGAPARAQQLPLRSFGQRDGLLHRYRVGLVLRIQARLRASDTVGRYGGEEFMLLLPGLDMATGGRRLEQLHREVCAAPVDIDGFGPLPVTCSGGVVVGRADLQLTAEQWIALADQALYRAKALGRNRLEYAPEAGLA